MARTYAELEIGAVYRSRHGRTVLEADNVWFTLLTRNVPIAISYPDRARGATA
jgi:acyl dehydratase